MEKHSTRTKNVSFVAFFYKIEILKLGLLLQNVIELGKVSISKLIRNRPFFKQDFAWSLTESIPPETVEELKLSNIGSWTPLYKKITPSITEKCVQGVFACYTSSSEISCLQGIFGLYG